MKSDILRRALPFLTVTLIVIVWECAVNFFEVPEYILPQPSSIAQAFQYLDLGQWFHHGWSTLRVALLAFIISLVIALMTGVALTQSKWLSACVYPLLVIIQAIPVIAVAPIIIVIFGSEDTTRILISVLITFFPLAISITTGLKETPSELIELSQSLRGNTWRAFTQIRIPYAIPHIFVGAKVSITLCIIGTVVAEFMAADQGLGYLIQFSTSMFKVPQAWASLTMLVAVTLSLFQIVCGVQKICFPWSLKR